MVANNRMYLRCRSCGETYPFAKWYPSLGWSLQQDPEPVNAWLRDHEWDHGEGPGLPLDDLNEGRWFDLVYEDCPVSPQGTDNPRS